MHLAVPDEMDEVGGHPPSLRFCAPIDFLPVTDRTLIKNLAAASDGPVSVSGWVDTVRDQKKVQFVVLRDESGAVQLVHPRTDVEEGSGAPTETRRDHLGPLARHLPHRHRRAQARRARQARRRRGEDRRPWMSRRPPSTCPSPTTPASTSAWTGASSTCAAGAEPGVPRPDHVPARPAHLVGRARLHRDPHPEAHGVRVERAGPSCSRSATSRARPTSRRARSSSSRWRSRPASARSSRSAPAFRADPSFTLRHATEFISVDAEIRWIDSHEDVMAHARGAARRRASRRSRRSTATRSRPRSASR